MNFEKAVESNIQEAIQRGDFDNLAGSGKPIDLTAYFDAPADFRAAYALLKNAGMAPREVASLQELAELRTVVSALVQDEQRKEIHGQIEQQPIEVSLMMEHRHRKQESLKNLDWCKFAEFAARRN